MSLTNLFQTQSNKRADASTSSPPKRQKSAPQPRGKGKGRGGNVSQKNAETDLIQSMAKLVLRHKGHINSLLSDIAYISYLRTDERTVVHELAACTKEWKADPTIADALRLRMTCSYFHMLLLRLDKLMNAKARKMRCSSRGYTAPTSGTTECGLMTSRRSPILIQILSQCRQLRRLSKDSRHDQEGFEHDQELQIIKAAYRKHVRSPCESDVSILCELLY